MNFFAKISEILRILEFRGRVSEARHEELCNSLDELNRQLQRIIEKLDVIIAANVTNKVPAPNIDMNPAPVRKRSTPWNTRREQLELEDLRRSNAEKEDYWRKQGGVKVEET